MDANVNFKIKREQNPHITFMHFIQSTAASQFTRTSQARLQLHFHVYQTSFNKMEIHHHTDTYLHEQAKHKQNPPKRQGQYYYNTSSLAYFHIQVFKFQKYCLWVFLTPIIV